MKLIGIRFCQVAEPDEAVGLAAMLRALGLPEQELTEQGAATGGAVFPTASGESWAEIWPAAEGMPSGTMLQFVVDDAHAFADHAKSQGLSPQGPMEAHGETIYFLTAPGGLPISFQSKGGS